MSGASERANGRAIGPVITSIFLAVFDHSAQPKEKKKAEKRECREKKKVPRGVQQM